MEDGRWAVQLWVSGSSTGAVVFFLFSHFFSHFFVFLLLLTLVLKYLLMYLPFASHLST